MRTLILYATRNGATKAISEAIAEHLDNVALQDIRNGAPSLADYDCVVLGSPLTAGSIRKEIKEFAVKHTDELKSKRLGLFVSGLQGEGEEEYLKQNFPADLLNTARAKAFLGGIFDPKKCGFAARMAIKAVAKLDSYTSTIDADRIQKFAKELTL